MMMFKGLPVNVNGLNRKREETGIVPRELGMDELLDQIAKLSPEQKSKLIGHLLNAQEDTFGVHVILGNGHNYSWHAGMVVQISSGNEELMQQIVTALAARIERGDLKFS